MAMLWTCPFCNRDCTVSDHDLKSCKVESNLCKEHGWVEAAFQFIICPNMKCRKITISASIRQIIFYNIDEHNVRKKAGDLLYEWKLVPESNAKPFPEYIPKQILNDYKEGCLIQCKSPKAAATLLRRCLQGTIRDFWGIKKSRLKEEIDALEGKVDSQTWQAIEAVRKIGNIGAHMEKDVNVIIDIEPEEVSLLINLIEILFRDWYIHRYEKEQRLQKLIDSARNKEETKTKE